MFSGLEHDLQSSQPLLPIDDLAARQAAGSIGRLLKNDGAKEVPRDCRITLAARQTFKQPGEVFP